MRAKRPLGPQGPRESRITQKRRPARVTADRGYDHDKYRRERRTRGITPEIARRQTAHGSGLRNGASLCPCLAPDLADRISGRGSASDTPRLRERCDRERSDRAKMTGARPSCGAPRPLASTEPLRLAVELLLALLAEHAIGLEHVDDDCGALRRFLSQEPGILTLVSRLYRL